MCDIYSNPLIAYDTLAVMYGWGWVGVGGGGERPVLLTAMLCVASLFHGYHGYGVSLVGGDTAATRSCTQKTLYPQKAVALRRKKRRRRSVMELMREQRQGSVQSQTLGFPHTRSEGN